MFIVTFRNSYDNLTSMITQKFSSLDEAKEAIELDGAFFKSAHNHVSKHDAYTGRKRRATARWVNPNTYDYYEVKAKDGESCIWQYFKI